MKTATEPGMSTGDTDPPPTGAHDALTELWSGTRAGARAARGFHYQDAVGAWLCGRVLEGVLPSANIVPESWEDLSCEGDTQWHVQVKSRQERIGDFRATDVAAHMLDVFETHADTEEIGVPSRPVLVLERPVDGESFTSWGSTLPREHPISEALRTLGRRRGLSEDHADSVRDVVSLYVLPWRAAAEQTRDVAAARYGLVPQAAEAIVLALRQEVADCADRNASEEWSSRAGLDRSRIEQVAAAVAALIDQPSLEQALSEGICEPVDFDCPLPESGFFEGLEVQPGHIAAGLPSPRPDLTGQVVEALERGTTALITGPSGVGKSTVMWASAYSTRHVLWYRVRRLYESDVDALIRLAKAMRPSSRTPVGFVVDGVGVGTIRAWDVIQREIAAVPGAVLLGSARSEDLLTLRTLPNCTMIRVALDEAVAERIHTALLASGDTTAPNWRESFEAADGLTLEYTHLLTRGQRLAAVITEQVNRRVVEHRDLELQILARSSIAHQWGADLPLRAVQEQLSADDAAFREALARLDAEHLVRIDGNRLFGLHQVRSAALATAVHNAPPPNLAESVMAVLTLLDENQLQPFITGALTAKPELDNAMLTALRKELASRRTPAAWTGVLQALRLVDFQRQATEWAAALDRHHVAPADRPITLQFAMLGSEMLPVFKDEIVAAVEEIRSSSSNPTALRETLLTAIGSADVSAVLVACRDGGEAARLIAVLAGTELGLAHDVASISAGSPLDMLLAGASAETFGQIVSGAKLVSDQLAEHLVNLTGGVEAVFAKLRAHSPWLVEVAVHEHADGHVAYARLLHVSDQVAPEVDESVRTFGRVLLRCLPQCDSVDVQALMPGGAPLQVGEHVSGATRLQREYDHPPTAVAWNTLRGQVAASVIGSMDQTKRVSVALSLIPETLHFLQQMTRAWCLSQGRPDVTARLEAQRVHLRKQASALTRPMERSGLFATPVDQALKGIAIDHLHTLVQGIGDNLTSRLHPDYGNWAPVAAYVGDRLRESAQAVRTGERWELMNQGPPAELEAIDCILTDLHAVLAGLAWGGLDGRQIVAIARSGSYESALSRAAEQARARARARISQTVDTFEAAALAAGLSVEVFTRPLVKADAVDWPPTQLAVGIHTHNILDVSEGLMTVTDLLTSPGEPMRRTVPILIVPLFDGRPVRYLARQLLTTLWPGAALLRDWTDDLPSEYPTPLTDAVIEAHQALQVLSGLAALGRARDVEPIHQRLVEQETERYAKAMDAIADCQPVDGVVAEVGGYLVQAAHLVQSELDEEEPGAQDRETFAAGISLGTAGTTTELFSALDNLILVSLQWDLDPPTAAELLAQLG